MIFVQNHFKRRDLVVFPAVYPLDVGQICINHKPVVSLNHGFMYTCNIELTGLHSLAYKISKHSVSRLQSRDLCQT